MVVETEVLGDSEVEAVEEVRRLQTQQRLPPYFDADVTRRTDLKGVRVAIDGLPQDIIEALSGYEVPVLENRTTHREVYAKTASEGLTVYHDLKAEEAMNEITSLKNEILEVLK